MKKYGISVAIYVLIQSDLVISNTDISKYPLMSKSIALPYFLLFFTLYPIALRKAKIVYNFGLSECNRVKLLISQTTDGFK